jgi:uncharacterized membrane protein YphA (DoxX/SURF4 family)
MLMTGRAWNPSRLLPPLLVSVVLLVVVIGLGSVVHAGVAFLGLVLGLLLVGSLGVAAYLWVRCQRPVAGVGTLITGISIGIAFYVAPQPWLVWTVLFFVGVGLIVWDTSKDTTQPGAWPLALLRIIFGWAWVDNAQDHFWNGQWFVGNGGGFAQVTTGAASRPPTYFVDPFYQGFLKGVVLPNADAWAALTACGELAFGVLLAVGFITPVAAFLSLWQSSNYILMKGFMSHGAYTDKVFFVADLVILVTSAGLTYGVDAALVRHVPAWLAKWFLGTGGQEIAVESTPPVGQRAPQPTPS